MLWSRMLSVDWSMCDATPTSVADTQEAGDQRGIQFNLNSL